MEVTCINQIDTQRLGVPVIVVLGIGSHKSVTTSLVNCTQAVCAAATTDRENEVNFIFLALCLGCT